MSIADLLEARQHDLGGGMIVRRLLPSARRQAVGPFLFFDHFGPLAVTPESRHDVRPHPHIGLATVTYLFEGAILHHDSLGHLQRIEPGAINWMTAGRGIVHSERRPPDLAHSNYVNHGIQLWAALPAAHEETEPAFVHHPAADLPEAEADGVRLRVLVGSAGLGGRTLHSPVVTFGEALYLDLQMRAGSQFEIAAAGPSPGPWERAIYPVEGTVRVDGTVLKPMELAVLEEDAAVKLSADSDARVLVLGGTPLDGPRLIWWNFVSTRRERILQAADDWEQDRMGQVPDDPERIPLPARRPV